MIWVIRAGQNALFYDKYLKSSQVFIPWIGYHLDLSNIEHMSDFRAIVESEKGTNNRTTISNWAGQLYSFVKEISINDLSLIPSMGSRTYVLVRIVGDYSYEAQDEDGLYHSRRITVLCKDIPRQIFPQSTIYSLGAYRTIFKVRDEKIILSAISKWIKEVKA